MLNPPVALVVKGVDAITPGAVIVPPGRPGGNPSPVTVTLAPGIPPTGARVMAGAWTVKVSLTETTPTVTVMVAGPKGAPGSMVTLVAGIAPAVTIVKPTGAMTPGAIITPGAPTAAGGTGKCKPLTVTFVPRAPAAGIRVISATGGTGGGVTKKVSVSETTPTVAVMVCSPRGAGGTVSMVTMAVKLPVALVVKVTGEITPGAVMMPGAVAGKPVPCTVTFAPRIPKAGERIMVGTGGGITVKVGEM